MAEDFKENERYRGVDLMEPQRKLLFQKLKDTIRQQQGELAYLLDCLEKSLETVRGYKRELERLHVHQDNPERVKELQDKSVIIDKTQSEILLALQPVFHEIFDQIAEETPPGLEYNEELRHNVRFDLIFGEREITDAMDSSRENYRAESHMRSNPEKYEKKLQKILAKRKAEREKVWLPRNHRLITEENYEKCSKRVAKYMEKDIKRYGAIFTLNSKDKDIFKQIIEKYFLYIFIQALIDTTFIFDMKSTKGSKCLDGTIEHILLYFEEKLGQKLAVDPKNIKKKLRANLNNNDNPIDLSYKHAILEDIDCRESYFDATYFKDKGTSTNMLRIEIMKEYNAQEGVREKYLELLNPLYHIYKDEVDKHKKHLEIIQAYQKKSIDQDPRITEIIQDINKKLAYAQEQKKEHVIFEESVPKIKPKYDHSLTEIQQKTLKRYQVPIQYRHVFGVVNNKLNNFYQIKLGLIKKADVSNNQLFQNLVHSQRTMADFSYYLNNYITNKDMDKIFDEKRPKKRIDRTIELANDIKKPLQSEQATDNQLSLNF